MKKFLFAVVVLSIVAVAAHLWVIPGTAPADGSLVGLTEPQVRGRISKPTNSFAGHYGAPGTAWSSRFQGEIKTEIFSRTGGTVYVSFEKRPGGWVAICNNWLPRGGNF